MRVTIECERDRVLLLFPSGTRDFGFAPDAAMRFAEKLEAAAAWCQGWVRAGGSRTPLIGQPRGAWVKSWDGNVNVRLDSPTRRESVPFEDARRLAAEIRARVPEAEARVSITWRPNLVGA